jgi:hypothetical protein
MKTAAPILTMLLLGGCSAMPGSFRLQETAKYSIENTGKFAPLDPATHSAVVCTGLQEHTGRDGQLEVVANVMNRGRGRREVQVRCVFKDANGFSIGDDTAWQVLQLDEDATEAVRFVSLNNRARLYTVAVRAPR